MKTVFLRALGADDKAAALREAIRAFRGLNHPESVNTRLRAEVFERDPAAFAEVQRSPFAYWVSDDVRETFRRFNRFEAEGRKALVGVATGNDARYVRCSWEVPRDVRESRWRLFAKGGKLFPALFRRIPKD